MYKKTHEQFIKDVYSVFGDAYTVLGIYTGSKDRTRVKHVSCGHEWEVIPNNFISHKTTCPYCFMLHRNEGNFKTQEEFKAQLHQQHRDDIIALDTYKGMETKIRFKHTTCGYEWVAVPNNLVRGNHGCPRCARERRGLKCRKSHQYFVAQVAATVGEEYTVIGQYSVTNAPLTMRHNLCGKDYLVTPNHFMQGCRCLHCTATKGEVKINDYLITNNMRFGTQYRIKACRDKKSLPFDFAVFDSDGNLLHLIEYDGEIHYKSVDYFGGEEAFAIRQAHDKIKTDYCAANNIPLLRIPYWDFVNIERILDELFTATAETITQDCQLASGIVI